ncbi:MAG: hypothetical protein K8F29_07845, partial [Kofleriaceae bacterium]|nr:hypothetical protein [Candidatus Methylomirabilis lanthanidiphila]
GWGGFETGISGRVRETFRAMTAGLLLAALTIPFCATAHGGGLEPYAPANEQLRRTILGTWESQAFRHPPALERDVREALRSINEIEGRTDSVLAALLSSRLNSAWTELEQSRAVLWLGYNEFDAVAFQSAESQFQEVVTQFLGVRTPYPAERYHGAITALENAQTLSRHARRHVPGLASDDVQLTREKRQKLLLKEPATDEGSGAQTGSQR